jgi:hypothetical protein
MAVQHYKKVIFKGPAERKRILDWTNELKILHNEANSETRALRNFRREHQMTVEQRALKTSPGTGPLK